MRNAPHDIDGRFERALENAEQYFMKTLRHLQGVEQLFRVE